MSAEHPTEPIIEPDLPIIDPHHHLWLLPETSARELENLDSALAKGMAWVVRRQPRYMFEELMADLRSGHNLRGTVAVEAHRMYRAEGPAHLRPVGEVEFMNGVAAIAASGLFGDIKACAGIVGGGIDLCLGEAVEEALTAQIEAAAGRYRGLRCLGVVYDADPHILGPANGRPGLLAERSFREGFGRLEPLGLSADIWILEPQLSELVSLARAFPRTRIVLNHVGSPTKLARPGGGLAERFPIWRDNMRELSTCANVAVKIGGLANPLRGFDLGTGAVGSRMLAELWRPYIETCIEAFGVERCMFESNFPIDSATCSYAVLWNAFKLSVRGASKEEKTALFHDTAASVYRLGQGSHPSD